MDKLKCRVLAVGVTSKEIVTGLSMAFDTFIEGLDERSIEYTLVDAGVGASINNAGVFSTNRMIGVFLVLFRIFKGLVKADIVYVTMSASRLGFIRDLFVILMTALFKRKLIFHLHGGGYGDFYQGCPSLLKFIIRYAFNFVDKIIVLGDLLRNQFSFLSENNRQKIVVVANGLPVKDTPAQEFKTISVDRPLKILYLSNMIPSKGYLQTLEACKLLKSNNVNFICDFAGEFMSTGSVNDRVNPDSARNDFFELISKYDLLEEVNYHGVVRGIEKQKLFREANIFLLPTNYSGEGQPISIIEALSYSVPVIATRFRGIPEQVEDGENGILIDSASPADIISAIENMTKASSIYEKMSAHAYHVFKEKFTREQYLNRLISTVLST